MTFWILFSIICLTIFLKFDSAGFFQFKSGIKVVVPVAMWEKRNIGNEE